MTLRTDKDLQSKNFMGKKVNKIYKYIKNQPRILKKKI